MTRRVFSLVDVWVSRAILARRMARFHRKMVYGPTGVYDKFVGDKMREEERNATRYMQNARTVKGNRWAIVA